MKRKVVVTMFALAICLVGGLTSCKKDYSCICKSNGVSSDVFNAQFNDVKKKDAKDACSDYETTLKSNPLAPSDITCSVSEQ